MVNLITRLKSRKLGAVILSAGALLMLVGMLGSVAVATHPPTFVSGNPTCKDLVEGESGEFVLDAKDPDFGTDGEFGDGTFSVTIDFTTTNEDGEVTGFNFSSASPPVMAVFVKAASGGNLYEFDPPTTNHSGLVAPGGHGISHISFCYVVAGTTTTTERGTTTTTAGETTTTTAGETTTTTAAPTTTTTVLAVGGVQITPTTAAPAQVAGAQILPVTGPSNSWTLFLVGMSFILGGLILVFGERQYRPRRNH